MRIATKLYYMYYISSRSIHIAMVSLFLLSATVSNAQSNHTNEELQEMSFKERMYFGGMLGASFGTITSVQVMPVVGYRIMHRWSAGIGAQYQYFKDGRVPSYDTHMYGGNIHTRVYIWDNLFAHGEFEVLSLEFRDLTLPDYPLRRGNIPALFVGAGYFMPIGQRSGFAITFLYDLIQDVNSPYFQNFTLRMGFVF